MCCGSPAVEAATASTNPIDWIIIKCMTVELEFPEDLAIWVRRSAAQRGLDERAFVISALDELTADYKHHPAQR